MAKHRRTEIRDALLQRVFWSKDSPVSGVADSFGITRQGVQRHLRALIAEGVLAVDGRGAHRVYELAVLQRATKDYDLSKEVEEHAVWEEVAEPILRNLQVNERDICAYGFTEMVNNARDHAKGHTLIVAADRTAISVEFMVLDDGVGIFQKIATALNLPDPRQSILELSKGKFTTDPQRHTGEGIFFTSRVFDRFSIRSGALYFLRRFGGDDWLVGDDREQEIGTCVLMDLLLPTTRRLEEIFGQFSSGPDDYRFSKTHVPLNLAQYGDDHLVSRSQAKRVLARVDRFDEVMLDFAKVRAIGHSFADEIWRVFASQHPNVRLIAINTNEQIRGMIERAKTGTESTQRELFDET